MSAIMRWATASRPATPGSRAANPAIHEAGPPGAKNLSTLLTEALNEPVVIAEDGGRRKISERQAIIKQLVNRSAKRRLARRQAPARHPAGHRRPDRTANRGELVQPRRRKGRRAVDGAAA